MNIIITIFIIIISIIITRPKPAFCRLGLGRLSGGKTSGVSLRLTLCLWRSARLWSNVYWHFSVDHYNLDNPHHHFDAESVMIYKEKYNETLLSLWQGREGRLVQVERSVAAPCDTHTHIHFTYIVSLAGGRQNKQKRDKQTNTQTLHHYIYIIIIIIIIILW